MLRTMGLFSKKQDPRAQAESDRLAALPPDELAVEVLPAFAPGGMEIKPGHQRGAMQVTSWLLRDHSQAVRYRQPILGPVIEALGVLDAAGLITRRGFGDNGSTYAITRAGEAALAEGAAG